MVQLDRVNCLVTDIQMEEDNVVGTVQALHGHEDIIKMLESGAFVARLSGRGDVSEAGEVSNYTPTHVSMLPNN